jgi:hypothetical protein
MSEGTLVIITYSRNGVEGTEKYRNLCMDSCVRRTLRKHGRGITKIVSSYSREMTYKDKCIPPPPEGWKFATFRLKQRKNRFGRLINDKPGDDDIF